MKLQAALDYIENELDADLGLQQLAKVACVSPYHFHRLFRVHTGLPPQQYCQRRRLQNAAYYFILHPQSPVTDVALRFGFASVEHFSRVFTAHCGLSPAAFKRNPNIDLFTLGQKDEGMNNKHSWQVEIEHLAQMTLAVADHRGAEHSIMSTLQPFIHWRKSNKLSPQASRTFNLYYGDPDSLDSEEQHMAIAVEVAHQNYQLSASMRWLTMPAIRVAKLTYVGPWSGVRSAADYLYEEWLGQNNEAPANWPLMIERLNLPSQVADHELRSAIMLPLR